MNKAPLFLLSLSAGLALNGCAPELTETEKLDLAVDEATQQVEDMNTEFSEQYQGGTPEEVLDARYTEAVKQYGEPSEYDTGLDSDGSHNMGHADLISNRLGLDYSKLVYVQIMGGTYGLQTILETMDSSNPEVKGLVEIFHNYHSLTNYDAEYTKGLIPSGLSDQEEAAFIVKTYADEYRLFYEGYRSIWISNPDMVDQVATLTGLNKDDLTMIFAYGNMQEVVNLLPDGLSYKGDLAELLDY